MRQRSEFLLRSFSTSIPLLRRSIVHLLDKNALPVSTWPGRLFTSILRSIYFPSAWKSLIAKADFRGWWWNATRYRFECAYESRVNVALSIIDIAPTFCSVDSYTDLIFISLQDFWRRALDVAQFSVKFRWLMLDNTLAKLRLIKCWEREDAGTNGSAIDKSCPLSKTMYGKSAET